jgi:hypothetical protein
MIVGRLGNLYNKLFPPAARERTPVSEISVYYLPASVATDRNIYIYGLLLFDGTAPQEMAPKALTSAAISVCIYTVLFSDRSAPAKNGRGNLQKAKSQKQKRKSSSASIESLRLPRRVASSSH